MKALLFASWVLVAAPDGATAVLLPTSEVHPLVFIGCGLPGTLAPSLDTWFDGNDLMLELVTPIDCLVRYTLELPLPVPSFLGSPGNTSVYRVSGR